MRLAYVSENMKNDIIDLERHSMKMGRIVVHNYESIENIRSGDQER